jgi:KDEL-tailed cysteine endopeptidase
VRSQGSVEGLDAIVTGKLKALSEQELVDCDTSHDHGCGGGLMDYAFDYIIDNGGLDTEANYPYVGQQQPCDKKKEARNVGKITGYEDVPHNNEKALLQAVSKHPVSIAIEADTFPFQFYATGVINTAACGTRLDHGVLIVGFGTDANTTTPYWIVKVRPHSFFLRWCRSGGLPRRGRFKGKGVSTSRVSPPAPL